MQCQRFWLINMQLRPNKSWQLNSCMSECLLWDIGVLIKCECTLASVLVVRTNFYSSDQSTVSHLYTLLWSWLSNFYPRKSPCTEIWSRMNKCMHFVIYLQKFICSKSSCGVFFMEQSWRATWKYLIFE